MAVVERLKKHRKEASVEFLRYKKLQTDSALPENPDLYHVVVDFAETVLLPGMLSQPGQLHFTTGLKFDLNGVCCSKTNHNYIFGLPEGHWPNEKTADSVLSMLHHAPGSPGDDVLASESNKKHLNITCDNCGGQNKNKFVIFYCAWLCSTKKFFRVSLLFLKCGHTKNKCDGCFGHVKRLLRRTDAITPRDMMRIIQDSSETNICVPSQLVEWLSWKEMLGGFFRMPAALKIQQYHEFDFLASTPGVVSVRKLSTSTEVESFNLLKPLYREPASRGGALKPAFLNVDWESWFNSTESKRTWKDLGSIESKMHETRENYLTVKVLDNYYVRDEDIREAYFQDGTP